MRLHIWALAGMAALVVAAGPLRAQGDPKAVVAIVNGHNITLGEVDYVLHSRLGEKIPPEHLQELRFDATCLLIDGRLWEDYLKKYGPRIDPSVVDKHVAELEQHLKNVEWMDQQGAKHKGKTLA